MILTLSEQVEASKLHEADIVKEELRLALWKWKFLTVIFGLCSCSTALTLVSWRFYDRTQSELDTSSKISTETFQPQRREITLLSDYELKLSNQPDDLSRGENEEGDSDLGHDIHIIRRSRWGGRSILDGYQNRTLVHPIKLVIIGHTGGRQCISVENCSSTLQSIQVMHVRKGWVDVGFNFLIGGDGNVYETLAWNIRNYIRNNSIMISFFGNYEYDFVKERQKMALQLLLNQGVKLGKLDPNYMLVAHNQVTNTLSPGTNLLKFIKQFSHYCNDTLT